MPWGCVPITHLASATEPENNRGKEVARLPPAWTSASYIPPSTSSALSVESVAHPDERMAMQAHHAGNGLMAIGQEGALTAPFVHGLCSNRQCILIR